MSDLLLAVNDFPPLLGGESTLYFGIASHLPPGRAIVLAPGGHGDAAIDARLPVPVERRWLPAHRGTISRIARAALTATYLGSLLLRRRVRYLVCGQLLSIGVPGRLLSRLAGVPYAVFVHGADLADFHDRVPWGGLARWTIAGADAVIANSRFTAGLIERLAPGAARRIVVLPIGVESQAPAETGTVEALRERYRLGRGPVLLSVSRLVAMKGHDVVLRALPELLRAVPGLHYLIVGEGPHRPALEALARAHGVAARVVFAGRVPAAELPAHFQLATLFVQLSRHTGRYDGLEGFGISFLEAASHGLPCIAGRSGGVPEAVLDGETGLLVEPEDGAAFGAAAARLLADPRERQRMGESARRWAAAHTWEPAADCLRSLAAG